MKNSGYKTMVPVVEPYTEATIKPRAYHEPTTMKYSWWTHSLGPKGYDYDEIENRTEKNRRKSRWDRDFDRMLKMMNGK